ncbi:MAG: NADH-quinone oxidoreductase subunit L [Bdellovibrionales bacterium RBG_16_40_8]|nr:MAG: NADH-quinone oxidoreductase subunit L [Bdellovibrionales bacterium RBG_16_40_8]
MLENSWVIAAVPFFSFLLVGLFIRPYSDKWAGLVATSALFISMLASYLLAWDYLQISGAAPQVLVPWSVEWLQFIPKISVHMGVLIDPISVMMMTVVTTVSFLVHVYSIGYMHGENGYGRYFTYLNLFTFSMLGLVSSTNIFQMYVFWELVGVSSFLLIGFYYKKPAAVAAAKKAFIVTRFADLGFLIGILILAGTSQTIYFTSLSQPEVVSQLNEFGVLNLALLLIFMGAAGKSAMFPLHIWLPDAMEGPTPVSALIHAATMVVAGVYLVARMFPLYSQATYALEVVAFVGLFTSAFAAIIACTQDDIKRVLAFSTLSQLGYMMFSLGIATLREPLGYTASMFHLYNHAFFKALLFLGAGAVIHAVHTNNIWEMGGLRKKMPITHITFLIAVLAISGIWPFSGFFSKDEILVASLHGHPIHFIGGLIVAGITAFYMSRIYFLTFLGNSRTEASSHAHEASPVMLFSLVVLAAFSCVTGFIPFSHYVSIGQPLEHSRINLLVAISGTLMALIGIFSSWIIYGSSSGSAKRSDVIARRLGAIYSLIKNKFYFDEIYQFVTHKIIFKFIASPIAWFDRKVVDGGVNLSGWSARKVGEGFLSMQTGQLQTYGVWFVIGTIVTFFLFWATVG